MLPFTRSQWTQIAPLLDKAFDLSGDERNAWLAHLARTRPDLAGAVELLLDVHHTCTVTDFPSREPLMRTVRRISRSLAMRDKVLVPPAPASREAVSGSGERD
jgi:hypothetical protein